MKDYFKERRDSVPDEPASATTTGIPQVTPAPLSCYALEHSFLPWPDLLVASCM
jgi:hypothetical protein